MPKTIFMRQNWCFDDVLDRKRAHVMMDAGLRVIETRRIVGTVDKCGELDSGFLFAHGITQRRFFRAVPFKLVSRMLYGKAVRVKKL